MRIAYYSDLHLEFGSLNYVKELFRKCVADVIVVAGDLMNNGEAPVFLHRLDDLVDIPIIYVPGNHDFYYTSKQAFAVELQRHRYCNVHILNTNIVDILGVRFVGATGWWTEVSKRTLIAINDFFNIKDIRQNENGSAWGRHDRAFFERHLKNDFKGKTVCISHHAPSFKCIPDSLGWRDYNDAYANNWDELLRENGPDIWIHGHIHQQSNDFCIGSTRVVSNPYGYHSRRKLNPDFQEDCIVEL